MNLKTLARRILVALSIAKLPSIAAAALGTMLRLAATISGVNSLVLCLLVVRSSLNVCAQSASTGALSGTVTDPTRAVVQNATVTLRDDGTDKMLTAVTDQDGSYRFSVLPPGEYELTVDAGSFARLAVRNVMILVTEVRRIATQLAVSSIREEVVVEAPLLKTEDAALGRVIGREAIVALPLVNRRDRKSVV